MLHKFSANQTPADMKKSGKHVRFCFSSYTTYKVKSNVINDGQFFITDFHESPRDSKTFISSSFGVDNLEFFNCGNVKMSFFICATFTSWKFPYAILFTLIYLFFVVVVHWLTHELNLFENNFKRRIVLFLPSLRLLISSMSNTLEIFCSL